MTAMSANVTDFRASHRRGYYCQIVTDFTGGRQVAEKQMSGPWRRRYSCEIDINQFTFAEDDFPAIAAAAVSPRLLYCAGSTRTKSMVVIATNEAEFRAIRDSLREHLFHLDALGEPLVAIELNSAIERLNQRLGDPTPHQDIAALEAQHFRVLG